MRGLTDRQQAVLAYIEQYVADVGYPPTIREIGVALDIRSTNGVNDHLKALERKGFIERDESKSRAIQMKQGSGIELQVRTAPVSVSSPAGARRPVEVAPEVVAIPLLGRIAAGIPIEAIEQAEEHLVIGADLLGRNRSGGEVFALRVTGQSMIGDGIHDGDSVFVQRTNDARQGEIVAVMVDGAATVKRWYRDGDSVRLEPSNPAIPTLVVRAQDARETMILGRVVGLFRRI